MLTEEIYLLTKALVILAVFLYHIVTLAMLFCCHGNCAAAVLIFEKSYGAFTSSRK